MPTRTLYVHSVTSRWSHSWKGSTQVWDVLCSPEPGPWTLELRAFDAFQASLCKRASELGVPLMIGTMDTKYGEKIVNVRRVLEATA